MVTFTVQVDEEFIKTQAQPNVDGVAEEGGMEALARILKLVAYRNIQKEIEDGKKDFAISQSDGDDSSARIFENLVAQCCSTYLVTSKSDKDGSDK